MTFKVKDGISIAGTTFVDGSRNITIGTLNGNTPIHSGNYSSYAAPSSHTHDYLPLSGGTIAGQLNVNNAGSATTVMRLWSAGSSIWSLGVGDSSGTNFNISSDFGSFLINKSSGNVTTSGQYYAGSSNLVLHLGNKDNYTYPPASHDHSRIGWAGTRTAESGTTNSTPSGFFEMVGAYNNGWPATYGNVLSANGGGAGQLYMGWIGGSGAETGELYYRSMTDWRTNWGSWRRIITDANYNSYALPLSGGTVSGTVTANYFQGGGWGVHLNPSTAAIRGNGGYGGALALVDGSYGIALWSQSGTLHFGLGSNTAVTAKATMDTNGNFNVAGALTQASSQVLHAGNYSSYALPLSGGTMTGNISFANDSAAGIFNAAGNAGYRPDDQWGNTYMFNQAGAGGWYGDFSGYYFRSSSASNWLTISGSAVNSSVALQQSGNQVLHAGNYSSYAIPISGGVNLAGSFGLNDARLYLRTNGDTNHYLWNADDDWEEMVAYSGTGFRVKSSTGTTLATFTTSAVNSSVALQQGGNQVLHAGNYTSYVNAKGGGWYGSGLPGSRWGGYSVSGGEISFGDGLPNAGQMGILIDGCYVAGENNGFWSMASDNTWGSRRGMYWDGSYLNFTTNTPTARFQGILSDGRANIFDEVVKQYLYVRHIEGKNWDTYDASASGLYLNYASNQGVFIGSSAHTALHAGNYNSYSPTLTGGNASGSWGISVTGTAHSLPTTYAGGQQLNPQVYFNSSVGLKVAMTAAAGYWSDTLWINGYAGGDVLQMCALHTQRNGTPRMYISNQASNATSYGTLYEFLTSYNYTSYSPSLTGSGASGSWGINITGNATSASNLASDTSTRFKVITFTGEGYDSGNGSLPTSYGIYQQGGGWSHPYPDLCIGFHTGIKIGAHFGYNGTRFYNNSDWATEIFSVGNGDNNVRVTNTLFVGDNTALHAGNYSSYAGGLSTGNNWTNYNYFVANRNTTSDSPPLQAFSNNGSGAIMSFHRGGYYAVNFGLDSDNVMRIGGWSASTNRLQMDMSGNLTMAGNVTAYSDERLKKDWASVQTDFITQLAKVKSGTYTRIDSEQRQAGVSAQDFQKLLPETVSEDNAGTLSLAYGNAALVSAVELAKEVIDLRAQVTELRALIITLINKDLS